MNCQTVFQMLVYRICLFTRACARMYENWEYRHLASLSQNVKRQHLVATSSTIYRQDWLLLAMENAILATFSANISKILLDSPWKVLWITVEMGFDQHKWLVLYVSLAFSIWTLISPIIAHRWNGVWRHQNDITMRGVHEFGHAHLSEWIWYSM